MVAFKPKNASAIKNIKIKDGKKRETVREKGNNNKNLWFGALSNAYVISFKLKCFIDYHSNFIPDFFALCFSIVISDLFNTSSKPFSGLLVLIQASDWGAMVYDVALMDLVFVDVW